MTNNEVHSAVVRWIAIKTGVTTIKAHQSGPEPSLPYVMVNMTGSNDIHDHVSDMEFSGTDEVTAKPVLKIEWRFSVHAYGTHPTDILRPLVSAIKTPQGMETAFPELVFHEISQIRNVPDWINNEWQPRAQLDLIVHGYIRDGAPAYVIEEYSFDIARAE